MRRGKSAFQAYDVAKVSTDDTFVVDAKDALREIVQKFDPAHGVGDDDTVACASERGCEPSLALFQLSFHLVLVQSYFNGADQIHLTNRLNKIAKWIRLTAAKVFWFCDCLAKRI